MIAILAGMLLPVLNKAKEKAKAIACVNNMKQCTLAFTQYSDTNNGVVLMTRTGNGGWDNLWQILTIKNHGQPAWSENQNIMNKKSIRCPSVTNNKNYEALESYALPCAPSVHFSYYDNAGKETGVIAKYGTGNGFVFYTKSLKYVSNALIVAEAGRDDSDRRAVNTYNLLQGEHNLIDCRHSGRTNMGFADGHASSLSPAELASKVPPKYITDNRNYIWLNGIKRQFR